MPELNHTISLFMSNFWNEDNIHMQTIIFPFIVVPGEGRSET